MAKGDKDGKPKRLRFEIGLLVTVALMFLFSAGMVIPLVGPFFAFTLGPLLAGYVGGRFVLRWDTPLLAFLSAGIVTGTQITILMVVLSNIPMIVHITLGGQEWGILIGMFLLNLVFCFLGAFSSGRPVSALKEVS